MKNILNIKQENERERERETVEKRVKEVQFSMTLEQFIHYQQIVFLSLKRDEKIEKERI